MRQQSAIFCKLSRNGLIITLFLTILSVHGVVLSQNSSNLQDDTKTKYKILVGLCERPDLYDPSLGFYYDWEYKDYSPDSACLKELARLPKDYNIVIVLGTWCGDSREQLPRFLKLSDLLQIDSGKLKLIGVDRQKQAVTMDISHLNILRVPTFIFFRNDKEIGRIIETPQISLEKDMLNILTNPNQ